MQAILKSKHQRFYNWLQNIRDKQRVSDDKLNDLENEMLHFYDLYLQKREELRVIILEYELRQKSIRNRVKGTKRFEGKATSTILILSKNNEEVATDLLPE